LDEQSQPSSFARNEKGVSMENTYTAVIKQDEGWWIGWIQEIPGVNCQERTKEELLECLRITLREALELNRNEALKAAETDFSEVTVTI
jgi:predicted RNase H-like HicB family nuclease